MNEGIRNMISCIPILLPIEKLEQNFTELRLVLGEKMQEWAISFKDFSQTFSLLNLWQFKIYYSNIKIG